MNFGGKFYEFGISNAIVTAFSVLRSFLDDDNYSIKFVSIFFKTSTNTARPMRQKLRTSSRKLLFDNCSRNMNGERVIYSLQQTRLIQKQMHF